MYAEYEHQLYICIFTNRSKYSPLKPDNVSSVLHYTCERESEQSRSAFITQQRDGHGIPRPQASVELKDHVCPFMVPCGVGESE